MSIHREGRVKTIIFKEGIYKRYPESNNTTDRNYFKRYICAGVNEYLHRAIYEDNFGKIPEGFDIHHIDWDPLNNDLKNLTCMRHEEHKSLHSKYSSKKYCEEHREEVLCRLKRARPKIEEWQKSEEGKRHYIKLGKISAEKRPFKVYICSLCGKEYTSNGTKSLYCSTKCSGNANSRKRRALGLDKEIRVCEICNVEFSAEKGCKTKCCSPKCGAVLRYRK